MFKNWVAFTHFHELHWTSGKDLFSFFLECIITTANITLIYSAHLNHLTFILSTSHQLKEWQDEQMGCDESTFMCWNSKGHRTSFIIKFFIWYQWAKQTWSLDVTNSFAVHGNSIREKSASKKTRYPSQWTCKADKLSNNNNTIKTNNQWNELNGILLAKRQIHLCVCVCVFLVVF